MKKHRRHRHEQARAGRRCSRCRSRSSSRRSRRQAHQIIPSTSAARANPAARRVCESISVVTWVNANTNDEVEEELEVARVAVDLFRALDRVGCVGGHAIPRAGTVISGSYHARPPVRPRAKRSMQGGLDAADASRFRLVTASTVARVQPRRERAASRPDSPRALPALRSTAPGSRPGGISPSAGWGIGRQLAADAGP